MLLIWKSSVEGLRLLNLFTRKIMIVYRTDKIITRDKVKENPDVLYLFGDNLLRKGLGGQAKEMRGEPNTLGIVSKKYPSNNKDSFYTDDDFYSWLEVF